MPNIIQMECEQFIYWRIVHKWRIFKRCATFHSFSFLVFISAIIPFQKQTLKEIPYYVVAVILYFASFNATKYIQLGPLTKIQFNVNILVRYSYFPNTCGWQIDWFPTWSQISTQRKFLSKKKKKNRSQCYQNRRRTGCVTLCLKMLNKKPKKKNCTLIEEFTIDVFGFAINIYANTWPDCIKRAITDIQYYIYFIILQ